MHMYMYMYVAHNLSMLQMRSNGDIGDEPNILRQRNDSTSKVQLLKTSY